MLTGIKIKNWDGTETSIHNPVVKISTDTPDMIDISGTARGVGITLKDPDKVPNIYRDFFNSMDKAPYVSTLADVKPNTYGNIWLLGGNTSQVDTEGGKLLLCDMSQEDRTPQIMRSIYDILRQIRLWVDAYKDTMLCTPDRGQIQWKAMLDEASEEDSAISTVIEEGLYTLDIWREDRDNRSDISAVGPATALRNEYQSVVALWNYIVSKPQSSLTVRTHPGDSAGIYVALTLNIPIHVDPKKIKESELKATITIKPPKYPEDSTPDKLWFRSPLCQIIAAGSGKTTTPIITFNPKGDKVVGARGSMLDESGVITDYPEGTLTATVTTILDSQCTLYTLQVIVDVIPFNLCTPKDADGNDLDAEKSYADSRQGMHYVDFGTVNWEIQADVSLGGESKLSETVKHTSGKTTVCTDTTADIFPQDYAPVKDEETV